MNIFNKKDNVSEIVKKAASVFVIAAFLFTQTPAPSLLAAQNLRQTEGAQASGAFLGQLQRDVRSAAAGEAEKLIRQNLHLLQRDLKSLKINPEEVTIVHEEVDEPSSYADFSTAHKTLYVYTNPNLNSTLENQIKYALATCIIATPARINAAERCAFLRQELLDGNLAEPDFYAFTVENPPENVLLAELKWAEDNRQLPPHWNEEGPFAGYVGKEDLPKITNGSVKVAGPRILLAEEQLGTIRSDYSGLINLRLLMREMIGRIVADRRQDLLDPQLQEQCVKETMQQMNTLAMWTVGAGSREAEVTRGIQWGKVNAMLASGYPFGVELLQELGTLLGFGPKVSLLDFIDSWQSDVAVKKTGVHIQTTQDRESLITNEGFWEAVSEACEKYGIGMVGHKVDIASLTDAFVSTLGWMVVDRNDKVVGFVEKPSTVEELARLIPEGGGVAPSWHLFYFSQEKLYEIADRWGADDFYLKRVDFSRLVQEPALIKPAEGEVLKEGEAPQEWMAKWDKRSEDDIQYSQEDWARLWCIAQEVFPDGLGFIDAGEQAIFFDTGAAPTLARLMRAFGAETDLGLLLRKKHRLEQNYVEVSTGGRALMVNSHFGPGVIIAGGSVSVNSFADSGRVEGVTTNVVVGDLKVGKNAWVSDIFEPDRIAEGKAVEGAKIEAKNHDFVNDWPLGESETQRITTATNHSIWKEGRRNDVIENSGNRSLVQLIADFNPDRAIETRSQLRDFLAAKASASAIGDNFERVGAGKFVTTQDVIVKNGEITLPNFTILSAEGDGEIRIQKGVVFEPYCTISAENGQRVLIGAGTRILKNSQICEGNVIVGENAQVDAVVTGNSIIGDGTIFQRGSNTKVVNAVLMPATIQTLQSDGTVTETVCPTVVNLTTNITNTVARGAMFFQDVQARDSFHYFSLMGGHVQTARTIIIGLSADDRTSVGHLSPLLDLVSLPFTERLDLSDPNERTTLFEQLKALRFGVRRNQNIIAGGHVRPLRALDVVLDGVSQNFSAGASNFGGGTTTSNFSSRTEISAPIVTWGRDNFGADVIIASPAEIGSEVLVANNAVASGFKAIEPGTLVLPQAVPTLEKAIKQGYILTHQMRLGDGVRDDVAIFTQAMYLYEVLIKVAIEGISRSQTDLERTAYKREMKLLVSLFNGLLGNFKGYLALIEPSVGNLEEDYRQIPDERLPRLAEQKEVLGRMAEINQAITDTTEVVNQAVDGAIATIREITAAKVREAALAALVIDRDTQVRDAWETRLKGWGFDTVLKAATAKEAQQVVEAAVADGRLLSEENLFVVNNIEQQVGFEGIAPVVTPLDINVPDETLGDLLENI